MNQYLHFFLTTSLIAGLSACTTMDDPDPLEPYNRAMFKVNKTTDKYVVKPVAEMYAAVTPRPARIGVTNFFQNLDDIPTALNGYLQGKPSQGLSDTFRFFVNSTFGVIGLFDVATHMGLPRHHADFGQTFGIWGIKESPYFVIPLLGPSTLRDATGLFFEAYLEIWPWIDADDWRYALLGLEIINYRANLLDSEAIVDAAAFDEYIFFRDAYLQKRKALIEGDATEDDWQEIFNYEQDTENTENNEQ